MKIVTLQTDLVWESATENLENIEKQLIAIEEVGDIWVLPEMFTTGFSMRPKEVAHPEGEPILSWMKKMSTLKNGCLVGSIAVEEFGQFYNRIYWVFPNGSFKKYDKKHLFRMAGEDEVYAAGSESLIVNYKGFRFMPLICYDLRFPVWSRNIQQREGVTDFRYDCAVYVANWPAIRGNAWTTLLQARAIENLCYVVGVNRVGEDGNGIMFDGKSRVFDAKGNRLDTHVDGEQSYSVVQLHFDDLVAFRNSFPAHLDADHYSLHTAVG
jgi:omega-amidase